MATAKTTTKSSRKVLSQAAKARLEKERIEASKSKAEKLADSIKRRSPKSPQHNSVQRQIDAVEERTKETRVPSLVALEELEKQLAIEQAKKNNEYAITKATRAIVHHKLLTQATTIRDRLDKVTARQETKLVESLRDCYGIYLEIENLPNPEIFYSTLTEYFKAKLEPIQSNTPDESLLIRFMFTKKTRKQVSEYATVIRYAKSIQLAKNDFVNWYNTTTQTKILQKARNVGSGDRKDKIARARLVIQRWFDIQEQWPLGYFEYPEYLAAKQVHLPNDLILVICRGVRSFNRDLYFDPDDPSKTAVPQAQIAALQFIPPNIDIANDLVDRMARLIAGYVEEFEEKMDKNEARVWAGDLSHRLIEEELNAAFKANDRWADRMQASLATDQQAFQKQLKKVKTDRKKARQSLDQDE